MSRNHFDAEKYEEAMIAATRRHFAKFVAELAAEGEKLETQAETDLYWEMTESFAYAELDEPHDEYA